MSREQAAHTLRTASPVVYHPLVTLEPANDQNVEVLIQWTLDPVAQGPYKRVPAMTAAELRTLFLSSTDRQYFLIRRTADGQPLGRFYYRAWRFEGESSEIDWELNLFIADPRERGKGYGTAAQQIVVEHLLGQPETRSVFAYTFATNVAKRRALDKLGFAEVGLLPDAYYRVTPPSEPCILYAKRKGAKRTRP
jgi:RimJ/RimL family protein N-acetyltransferase